jgi:hypothetical protein
VCGSEVTLRKFKRQLPEKNRCCAAVHYRTAPGCFRTDGNSVVYQNVETDFRKRSRYVEVMA